MISKLILAQTINYMTDYCDIKIGKGVMGNVIQRKIGETLSLQIKDTIIDMPVVIKKPNRVGSFQMIMHNEKLLLVSFDDLTCEAIMMYFVSKLWYKSISPHLLFMVGMNNCSKSTTTLVDEIISEKQGLTDNKKVTIEFPGFVPLFWVDKYKHTQTVSLATMHELTNYIITKCDTDNNIILPNNKQCNVIELLDGLLISFLHTSHLLFKTYRISLSDQHFGNIFIHWLNPESYIGDKYIGDIEHIVYNVNTTKLKINVPGLILKIGDIGTSVMKPQKNLFVIGQLDMSKKPDLTMLKYYENDHNPVDMFFMTQYLIWLPIKMLRDTIAYKILFSDPFDKFPIFSEAIPNITIIPTPEELLSSPFFEKYRTNNIIEEHCLVI